MVSELENLEPLHLFVLQGLHESLRLLECTPTGLGTALQFVYGVLDAAHALIFPPI